MTSSHLQAQQNLTPDKTSASASKPKPTTLKVILIGEGGVGKTCLVQSFCDKMFHEMMKTTIGAALATKIITVEGLGDVRLVIWDIGGEKRFNDMAPSFFIGADGALVVFDLSRPHTLHALGDWVNRFKSSLQEYVQRLKSTCKNPSLLDSAVEKVNNVSILVLGNKTDIRTMPRDVGQKFAEENGGNYFETSAKNFDEVNGAFRELTKMICKRRH